MDTSPFLPAYSLLSTVSRVPGFHENLNPNVMDELIKAILGASLILCQNMPESVSKK
jgi:hypothetical protein